MNVKRGALPTEYEVQPKTQSAYELKKRCNTFGDVSAVLGLPQIKRSMKPLVSTAEVVVCCCGAP